MISRDSALLHTAHRLCYDTMDWAGWGGVGEVKRGERENGRMMLGERRGGKIVEEGMG